MEVIREFGDWAAAQSRRRRARDPRWALLVAFLVGWSIGQWLWM